MTFLSNSTIKVKSGVSFYGVDFSDSFTIGTWIKVSQIQSCASIIFQQQQNDIVSTFIYK